jgi:L-malate glycosyltransferase
VSAVVLAGRLQEPHRRSADVHVLILPSWYPSDDQPIRGIFFREQALTLASAGFKTGVIFAEQRTLRLFSVRALARNHWQHSNANIQGVQELRRHAWSLRPRELFRQLWVKSMIQLGKQYVRCYGKPDVLHVHSSVSAAEPAHALGYELSIPFVVTEHRSLFLQRNWSPPSPERTRAAMRAAGAVSAVSRRLARAVEEFVPGITCRLLPNVVDTEFFGTVAALSRPNEFRVLTACGLTPIKGVDVLIRAFSVAFEAHSRARLVIAGDGPERDSLIRLAQECGISDRVEFLGFLNRDELRREMGRASILALASHTETFGVIVIEALAAGLPVVATRCGGPDDILTDEVGWLVTPGDADSLSDALSRAREATDSIDRRMIAEFAREQYGRPSYVSRIRELYARIR